MARNIIKLNKFKNTIWIFLFLSFSQIVLLPFLRTLIFDTLYKPVPINEINLILKKVCIEEGIENANENSIIYNICDKRGINSLKK